MTAVFIGNADVWSTRRMPVYSDPVKAGLMIETISESISRACNKLHQVQQQAKN